MRFILANLYSDSDEKIDFTNIYEYSSETGKKDRTKRKTNGLKIIKSHDTFRENYNKVIYIIRDGRDVYTSYYFYLKNSLPQGTTFNDFLLKIPGQYGRWSEHVHSWMEKKPDNILCLRYEELKRDLLSIVRSVIDFCGVEERDGSINDAIARSDFSFMSELERKHGRGIYKSGPDVFMRKGEVGDWKKMFDDDSKNIFKDMEGDTLIKLGYEMDHNW